MDQLFNGLFGAQDTDNDDARRQRAADFVNRVEQGDPAEGFSTEEAVQNYKSVTGGLSDSEYADAAQDALSRFSPEQRREFGQLLSQQTGANIQGDIDDPQEIAQVTTQLRSSGAGGGLAGLLGGGGGDDLMSAISGLIGGGGGSAVRPGVQQAGGIGDLLRNPIVKAILGAIAAAAMRKYAGGGRGASGGGGLLDGLFGGGNEPGRQTAPSRPTAPSRESRTRESDDNGGGLLDSLFGGGSDDDDRGKDRKRSEGGANDLLDDLRKKRKEEGL